MMTSPNAHRIIAVTIKTTPNTKTAAPPPSSPAAPEDGREIGAPFSTPQDDGTATDEPRDGSIVTVVVTALHALLVVVVYFS